MLRQFVRRAHQYTSYTEFNKTSLDWLAMIQHYGAPTRLLDFSHSLYISAFFALETANTDAAIWAINIGRLEQANSKALDIDSDINIDHFNQEMIKVADSVISNDGKEVDIDMPLVLHVEPDILHERILNQQGFFLFPTDHQSDILDVLGEVDDDPQEVSIDSNSLELKQNYFVKFIIPIGLRDQILGNLEKMNISARTLFPGLDGFARSMLSTVSLFPGKE